MDVKDPSASVRHPLSGVAPSATPPADAAPDGRAERRDYGDEGYGRPKDRVEPPPKDFVEQRPKDIIGPTDFTETKRPPTDFVDFTETPKRPPRDFIDIREPDAVDFTDVADIRDFKDVIDVKDFVDVKDIVDIRDFKDIKDIKDLRDFKDVVDFQDIIERPEQQ